MISGGKARGEINLSSVEVFIPTKSTDSMPEMSKCNLPPLPVNISSHSQDGLLQCGGAVCYNLTKEGLWRKSHDLRTNRWNHTSFSIGQSVILMGGEESPKTTEKVSDGSEPFQLKYETM